MGVNETQEGVNKPNGGIEASNEQNGGMKPRIVVVSTPEQRQYELQEGSGVRLHDGAEGSN